LTIQQKTVI